MRDNQNNDKNINEKEIKVQEDTNYFKKAPKALQNVVRLRFGAGIVFLLIGIMILIFNRSFALFFPPIVIGFVGIFSSVSIRNAIINGTHKTFSGVVVDYDYAPLSTKVKSVVFSSGDKRYKVTYSARKVKTGDTVTVYSPPSAAVYERNGCYYINEYYVVDLKHNHNNNNDNNGDYEGPDLNAISAMNLLIHH